MSNPTTTLPPGFRFHPTDEELILHYLRNRAAAAPCPVSIIAEVDIYKFDPWELPAMATFGDREWYFFSPRDRKYPNGLRPNRAAGSGYWKATGTDKPIHASTAAAAAAAAGTKESSIGVKKALVFYTGKPPKGRKTDWIMHEYRLAEVRSTNAYKPLKLRDHSMRLDDWVLCRIYKKNNNLPSSAPLLMDPEQEDYVSGAEDGVTPALQAVGVVAQEVPPKSFSMSELFDDYSTANNNPYYFGAVLQPEPPRFDYSSLLAQPPIGSNSNNGVNDDDDGSSYQIPTRQQVGDGYDDESCFVPNLSSQFDSAQYGLFSQQLLLNSHLGLH